MSTETETMLTAILDNYTINADSKNGADPLMQIAALDDPKILKRTISSVEEKIAFIKVQVHNLIIQDYRAFITNLSLSEELCQELDHLFASISKTSHDVQEVLAPSLFSSLYEMTETTQRNDENKAIIGALEHLEKLNSTLTQFESALENGRMDEAASSLQSLEYNIVTTTTGIGSNIIRSLTRNVADSKDSLASRLDDIINEAITFHTDPPSIIVSKNVKSSSSFIEFESVFSALMEVNSVDTHLSNLARKVIKVIIDPYLDGYMFSKATESHNSFSILQNDELDNDPDSDPDVFSTLSQLFSFLSKHVFSDPASYHTTYFGKVIASDLSKSIETKYLAPLIPLHVDDLCSFDAIASKARQFEKRMQSMNFVPSDYNALTLFVDMLDVHFVAKKRDALLKSARELIITEKFEQTIAVEEITLHQEEEPETVMDAPAKEEQESTSPSKSTSTIAPSPEKPIPTFTLSPSSSIPRTLSPARALSPAPELDEIDVDDGWGFDEEKQKEVEAPQSEAMNDTVEESDGWGFGEDTEETDTKQVEHKDDDTDNGWEWGNDEEKTTDASTAKTSVPAETTAAASVDPADWAWGDDEDETGWSEEKKHAKRMSRQFGGPMSSMPAPPSAPAAKIPAPPLTITQEYTISKSCDRYISLTRQILSDAKDISSMRFENTQLGLSSGRLLTSTRELFDLYRAVMPSQHAESLTNVPALGMQFYNDCNYLVKELQKIEREYEGASFLGKDGQSRMMVTYDEPIRRLSHLGHRYYQLQLERQEQSLLEILEQANNFTDVADEIKFAKCQSAIEGIKLSIRQVAKTLKATLTRTMYFQTIGTLIESVVLRITDDIEDLIDIGETESEKLGQLCKMLYDLDDIFVEDGQQSTIVLHVPHWLKFNYLAEVLEASMADIMYLFRQGALVDFSTRELEQLICALFADTPLREKNLQEIRST